MPIYEYGCTECGKRIEAFQKISDPPLTECPDCSGELTKLVSNTSFVLKGGGWYADGYTNAPVKGEGDSKPAEAKTETKPDSAPKKKDKPTKKAK